MWPVWWSCVLLLYTFTVCFLFSLQFPDEFLLWLWDVLYLFNVDVAFCSVSCVSVFGFIFYLDPCWGGNCKLAKAINLVVCGITLSYIHTCPYANKHYSWIFPPSASFSETCTRVMSSQSATALTVGHLCFGIKQKPVYRFTMVKEEKIVEIIYNNNYSNNNNASK